MALPYPQTVTLPCGDSRVLRFLRPKDHLTGALIDPEDYEAVDFAVASEGGDSAAVAKSLGNGITIDPETSDVLVTLTSNDTASLGPGEYRLQARLSRDGGATRYTLMPIHRLVLTPSPL